MALEVRPFYQKTLKTWCAHTLTRQNEPLLTDWKWHLYNLIRPNDLLRATAIRRVTNESATGATSSRRVTLTLVIRVKSTDFDPQASQLHVSGQVAEENQHVKLGGFHTLDLELHRNLTLEKGEGWDSIALGILQDALDQTKKAELFAVVMQDGLANICLITEHQTVLKGTVQTRMPGKRSNARGEYDKVQFVMPIAHLS